LKKNLALTGMMGVGKSTVGRALSARLLMQFSDVDQIIERQLNMDIHEIFREKGETFFRKLEEKITIQEAKRKNTVISLGGGAFMNSKIKKNILFNCKSFWLDLDVKFLKKRLVKSKKRPLLIKKNLEETLEKIYEERKDTYADANYRIDCEKLSTKSITNKIIKIYANN
jgi:shikimate kinase